MSGFNGTVFKGLTEADIINNRNSNDVNKPLSAAQGKALNDIIGNIGTVVTGTNAQSSISVPNDTGTAVSTITLTNGKWVIIGCGNWAPNSNGYRQISFANNNINPARQQTATMIPCSGSKETYQQVVILVSLSKETTYTLYARQDSGGAINCYPWIWAIRII